MIPPSEPAPTGLHPEARPTIALADVSFAYRRTPVVVGVRWDVPSHGVTALLGRTGAGKSTLLALMAGALTPDSGSVRLDGRNPAQSQTRRLIGFMPQLGGLYGDLSVEENIAVFAAGTAASQAAVEATIDLLHLKNRRRDLVRELSAGYQRRVSLGAALVGAPSYLLLDDPFAFADAELTGRLWAHFKELAAKGRTLVVATTSVETAARADSVAVLRGGRLVASHAVARLAPQGRGKVVLHFREKTGPRSEVVAVEDYRRELAPLVTGATTKPFEVDVQPETLEEHLAGLLKEDG